MNQMISRSVIISTVALAGMLLLTRAAAAQEPPSGTPPPGFELPSGTPPPGFPGPGGGSSASPPTTGAGQAALTYGLGPPLPSPDPLAIEDTINLFRRLFGEQSTGGPLPWLNPVEPSDDSDPRDTTSGSTGGALPQEEPSSDTTRFTTLTRVVDALDAHELELSDAAGQRKLAEALRERARQWQELADRARRRAANARDPNDRRVEEEDADRYEAIAQGNERSAEAEVAAADEAEERANQRLADARNADEAARQAQQARTEREQQQAVDRATELRGERDARQAGELANNNETAVARAQAQVVATGHLNQDRTNAGRTGTQSPPLETSTGAEGIDMAALERKKVRNLARTRRPRRRRATVPRQMNPRPATQKSNSRGLSSTMPNGSARNSLGICI